MRTLINKLQAKMQRLLKKQDFSKEVDRLPTDLSKEEIYRLAYINGFWAGATEATVSLQDMVQ